jgi:hypothetical protein
MEYTQRGFRIYRRLHDVHGREARVQESSLATAQAAWIFCADDEDGESGIQVNRAGAIEIIDGLTAFLAHTDGIEDLPEV